jgi:GNAT superfamily N-acetyltransferase
VPPAGDLAAAYIAPDDSASPTTLDRVGPHGGVASDSAFGVALVTLWQRAAESGAPVGFAAPVVRSDIAARAAAMVEEVRTGRLIGVAANRARRLVGVAFLRPGRGDQSHTGRIELVLVERQWIRTGLGSRLISDLLARATDLGLDRLDVAVPAGTGVEEFFGGFGFTEWGRRPGWIRAADAGDRDEIVMGVTL